MDTLFLRISQAGVERDYPYLLPVSHNPCMGTSFLHVSLGGHISGMGTFFCHVPFADVE
jgi:hypothetical protein